jgi:hypothetical protein
MGGQLTTRCLISNSIAIGERSQACGGGTGFGNVSLGNQSLINVGLSGNCNVSIGHLSTAALTSGACNVVVGTAAGTGLTIGAGNIIIGQGAAQTLTSGSNNVYIGRSVSASTAAFAGEAIIKVNVTTARFVDGGSSWQFPSDARLKENVKNYPLGLDFVKEIQPRTYTWIDSKLPGSGFIAQELDEIVTKYEAEDFAQIVNKDNPDAYSIGTPQLIPALVNAIKELSATVEGLQTRIEELNDKVNSLSQQ